MKKDKEIRIGIEEINEVSYKLTQPPVPYEEIVLGQNLIFGLGFKFDVDLDNSNLKYSTLIRYIIEGFEEPIVEMETEIVFNVINLDSVLSKTKDNELEIDDDFLATLTGVCIGTVRGLLAANLKGSPMAKFPLPILNPKDILKKRKKQDEENE
jgi:hypothetical protein